MADPDPAGRASRWHAPRDHGAALVDPPLTEAAGMLAANVAARERSPWRTIATQSRAELLAAAIDYTRRYRDVARHVDSASPIILAGHQPELFHPGVWFKNFVLDRVAHFTGGVAINLIVDNDLCQRAAIRVPTGSVTSPRLESVPFDVPAEPLPYEVRPVRDGATFRSFPERVRRTLAPLLPATEPLVGEPLVVARLWPVACERLAAGEPLGLCLAQARHRLEADWGLETLEVPLSWACRTVGFTQLAATLLTQAGPFREVYNAVIRRYQVRHHLRSAAHPAPALIVDDDAIESPLWLWTDGDPTRRRLFVQPGRSSVVVTDRGRVQIELPGSAAGDLSRTVDALRDLEARGIRIRPRALVTTLFARLLLGDLFLHGIGGAKYDEVTDDLLREFFHIEPPRYMVVSATCRLPILNSPSPVEPTEPSRMARLLRELTYQPERHVAVDQLPAADQPAVQRWLDQKRYALTHEPTTRAARRAWHEHIAAANAALQPWLAARRVELLAEQSASAEQRRAAALLASREFSAALFPEKSLRDLLLGMTPARG